MNGARAATTKAAPCGAVLRREKSWGERNSPFGERDGTRTHDAKRRQIKSLLYYHCTTRS